MSLKNKNAEKRDEAWRRAAQICEVIASNYALRRGGRFFAIDRRWRNFECVRF